MDLGCGDGTFLTGLAAKFPERNFLGIERLAGRVRSASGKAERAKLPNVRVLLVESSYAVQYLLPPNSAAVIHLLFPDPWPKKRHHRRRIVTPDFFRAVHRTLEPCGRFRIATDQEDYYQAIRELILPDDFREETEDGQASFPLTTFEKRFVAQKTTIYRLELRKIS